MKKIVTISVFLGLTLSATFHATSQELTLQRVTLFTSGVAEFSATGEPDSDGILRLPVAQGQLDDVLRSLTVISERAPVQGITFPSGEEIATRLARYQIDLNRVDDLASLLKELRGTDLSVATTEGSTVAGRVVGATATDSSGELILFEGGAVRRIPIGEIATIRFRDSGVEREFSEALGIIGESGGPESPRTLRIQLPGGVTGPVTVRYLREMPLWKTSYRAVIDDDVMLLQGWAHVHNVTTIDWDRVALSIVSARPVTYRADLYTPEWVNRVAPSPVAPTVQASRNAFRGEAQMMMDESAAMLGSTVEVTAQSQALPAGVVFEFPNPVTLPSGRSAMIPIVEDRIDAQRVRSFDPRRDGDNPRVSVSFQNEGIAPLPGGIVTVYDGPRYAGDSILSTLFVGDTATLPYAIDIAHTVVDESEVGTEELRSVRIVDGLLLEEHRQRRTTRFRIERNGPERPESIEITMGMQSGWNLISPQPIDREGQDRTFRTTGSTLTVQEERIRQQRVALTSADQQSLLSYGSNRLIDPTVRRALQNVVELRRQLDDARRERTRIEEQIATIETDQQRISQNMANLERDSSLYRRYVRELDAQEDQIDMLQSELSDARQEERDAESALNQYIRAL